MADERTSPRVASAAGRVLRDKTATDDEKSVAASALAQAENQQADGSQQAAGVDAATRDTDAETRGTGDAGNGVSTASGSDRAGLADETGTGSVHFIQPIRVRFAPLDPATDTKNKPRVQSPVVEVANGTYHRKFVAAEQPFEVTGVSHIEKDSEGKDREVVDITPEEELRILLADGNFVVDGDGGKEESATGEES